MKKTSIEAHESVKPHKPTQKQIILETMRMIGKPCTPEQISAQCRLNYYQVQRRLKEMKEDNLIIETEHTAKNSSGRNSMMWEVRTNQLNLF